MIEQLVCKMILDESFSTFDMPLIVSLTSLMIYMSIRYNTNITITSIEDLASIFSNVAP